MTCDCVTSESNPGLSKTKSNQSRLFYTNTIHRNLSEVLLDAPSGHPETGKGLFYISFPVFVSRTLHTWSRNGVASGHTCQSLFFIRFPVSGRRRESGDNGQSL